MCWWKPPSINEPYHQMASQPTLWLTEIALAKCHRQAECTCEIIGGKWMIHKWIGQSLLLVKANPGLSRKTLSQISNTTLIFEYRKHFGQSSNVMNRTAQLRNVKLLLLTSTEGKHEKSNRVNSNLSCIFCVLQIAWHNKALITV